MNSSELALQLDECLSLAASNLSDEDTEAYDRSKGNCTVLLPFYPVQGG